MDSRLRGNDGEIFVGMAGESFAGMAGEAFAGMVGRVLREWRGAAQE